MPSMAAHDLRRRAVRLSDLQRRHTAHEPLSELEMAELRRGIPAEDMKEIVDAIRGERRAAAPSAKVVKAAGAKAKAAPVTVDDMKKFLHEEH